MVVDRYSQKAQEDVEVIIELAGRSDIIPNNDLINVYWIEDIFSMMSVGKITFLDKKGIIEEGPLTGQELITINVGDSTYTFVVHSIDSINPLRQEADGSSKKNRITLSFTDISYHFMFTEQFSKSWKEKKTTEIIKDISKNFVGVENFDIFENAKQKTDFISPNWTPAQCIKYLLKESSTEDDNYGYLYFQNKKGFNCCSISKLIKEDNVLTTHDDDDGIYKFNDPNVWSVNKILEWKRSGIDNFTMQDLKGGKYKGYSITEKKLIDEEISYKKLKEIMPSLGKAGMLPDFGESTSSVMNIFGDNDIEVIKTKALNSMILNYCLQNMIVIVCPGYSERYAGGLIEIEWPSINKNDLYSKPFTGKYLVKSITHYYGSNLTPNYQNKMILIKNAYDQLDQSFTDKGIGGSF